MGIAKKSAQELSNMKMVPDTTTGKKLLVLLLSILTVELSTGRVCTNMNFDYQNCTCPEGVYHLGTTDPKFHQCGQDCLWTSTPCNGTCPAGYWLCKRDGKPRCYD